MAKPEHYLITCEHGGNRIPPRYRPLFAGIEALLQTHRGYDPGALAVARELAKALAAPLFVSTISRLLVDLNRSIGHPRLYSEATRRAPVAVRREILEKYYLPYRNRVERYVGKRSRGRRVIHLSSHSFTPVLDGAIRNADIGLLYDPARRGEMELCRCWQRRIRTLAPQLKVRRNYPYAGTVRRLHRLPAPPFPGRRLYRHRTGDQSEARFQWWAAMARIALPRDRGFASGND